MIQDSDRVVIRVFSHPHEAHLACSALQAAEIDASVADDQIVAANWLYSDAVGGVKVLVPAQDAATARAVLDTAAEIQEGSDKAASDSTATAEVVACPRCGGHDLRSVTPGKRIAFLSWLVVGLPLFPVLRRMRCHECGHVLRVRRQKRT